VVLDGGMCCHPWSIPYAQKKVYSYILKCSEQRKLWGGAVYTSVVLDKATSAKSWKKFLSQVCAIMRGGKKEEEKSRFSQLNQNYLQLNYFTQRSQNT